MALTTKLTQNLITGLGLPLEAIRLKGSSAGTVQTASFTADLLILGTALNGIFYAASSMSVSFNGATTGANAMDTGSMPTNGNLYIYAIYNPTTQTLACLGTTSGTGSLIYPGSNLPSGYTASLLIWSGVTNGTNFRQWYLRDKEIFSEQLNVLSNAAGQASMTSQSLSTIVPANATKAFGLIQQQQSAGTVQQLGVGGDTTTGGGGFTSGLFFGSAGTNSANTPILMFNVPMITAQTLYWISNNTTASSVTIGIRGYTI